PSTSHTSTLSLHDALPISYIPRLTYLLPQVRKRTKKRVRSEPPPEKPLQGRQPVFNACSFPTSRWIHMRCSNNYFGASSHRAPPDRKSTRLNSSHVKISYA